MTETKRVPVPVVMHLDELPTYEDRHGGRRLKILFDDDTVSAKHVAAEYIVYQPGDAVRMHAHNDSEHAFIILEGEGAFEAEKGKHNIRAGSVVFMPVGASHRIENTGKSEMKSLEIFAPPTPNRKKGLTTCYVIPQWKHFFDEKLYEEKRAYSDQRKKRAH
jgi:quercetin dioxygenase-like cupin family protein